MRKNSWARIAMAIALSLPLTACKDTKTLQQNEQLKAQVAELQRENGQFGNILETVTAAREGLAKENEKLKAEIKARKTKRSGTKTSSDLKGSAVLRSGRGLECANRFLS